LSSDAVQELFLVIESLENTVRRQNDLIIKLITENEEKENLINSILREHSNKM